MDWDDFYKKKFEEIPPDFLKKSVEFLSGYFQEDMKVLIREAFAKEGSGWLTSYHFGWGMTVRNALRTAGLTDDSLPDKNWDDYYGLVVEIACGLRSIDGSVIS